MPLIDYINFDFWQMSNYFKNIETTTENWSKLFLVENLTCIKNYINENNLKMTFVFDFIFWHLTAVKWLKRNLEWHGVVHCQKLIASYLDILNKVSCDSSELFFDVCHSFKFDSCQKLIKNHYFLVFDNWPLFTHWQNHVIFACHSLTQTSTTVKHNAESRYASSRE